MRIALIAPTYLPARRANTIQVMKMAQAITLLGHQVRVFVPTNHNKVNQGPPEWGQLASHYGLRVKFEVKWLPANLQLRRYDYSYLAVRAARKWQVNQIYTRLPQAAVLAAWLGMDTIFEVHDIPQGTFGPLLFRSYLNAPGARHLILITNALKKELVQIYDIPANPPFTLVAPDGVDLARYHDLPDPGESRRLLSAEFDLNIDHQRFTVGYTGHFYSGRGIRLMLKVAERLPSVAFLLVGGEQEDIARLRLEVELKNLNNLILTGFISNAELPLYQAACDVLLMPYQYTVAGSSGGDISRYLSPMKLFEYMACGRPILSSDLPVFREVLNKNNAILLDPDDVNQWVKCIEVLQSDQEQRTALAFQAEQDVKKYTWEARAKRILANIN